MTQWDEQCRMIPTPRIVRCAYVMCVCRIAEGRAFQVLPRVAEEIGFRQLSFAVTMMIDETQSLLEVIMLNN